MEPAASIIKALGGPKAVAAALGVALTAPYRWQTAEEKGGTGGTIPRKYHARLLGYAADVGIPITKASLVLPEADAETSHEAILKTRNSEEHA